MRITNPIGKVSLFTKKSFAGSLIAALLLVTGAGALTASAQSFSAPPQSAQVVRTSNNIIRDTAGKVFLNGKARFLFRNDSPDDVYVELASLSLYGKQDPDTSVNVNFSSTSIEHLGGATPITIPPGFYSSGQVVYKIQSGASAYFRTSRAIETKDIPSGVYAWGLSYVQFYKAPHKTDIKDIGWNDQSFHLEPYQMTGPKTAYVAVVGEKGPNLSSITPYPVALNGTASFVGERINRKTDVLTVRNEGNNAPVFKRIALSSNVFTVSDETGRSIYSFTPSNLVPEEGYYEVAVENPLNGKSVDRLLYVTGSPSDAKAPVMTNVSPNAISFDQNNSFGTQSVSFDTKYENRDTDFLEIRGNSTTSTKTIPLNSPLITRTISIIGTDVNTYSFIVGQVLPPITQSVAMNIYSPTNGRSQVNGLAISQSGPVVVTPTSTVKLVIFNPSLLVQNTTGAASTVIFGISNSGTSSTYTSTGVLGVDFQNIQKLRLTVVAAQDPNAPITGISNLICTISRSAQNGTNQTIAQTTSYPATSSVPAFNVTFDNTNGSLNSYFEGLQHYGEANNLYALKTNCNALTITPGGNFGPTIQNTLQLGVRYATSTSQTPSAVSFDYPHNDQTLNWSWGNSYLFKATASGSGTVTNYRFNFSQNGVELGTLNSQNGQIAVQQGDDLYKKIHSGLLKVSVDVCYSGGFCLVSGATVTVNLVGQGVSVLSPVFAYPVNGQVLGYGHGNSYQFKVSSPGAFSYYYQFGQIGTPPTYLSASADGIVSIDSGSPEYAHFIEGDLKIAVSAIADNGHGGNSSSSPTLITVKLADLTPSNPITGTLGFTYPAYPFVTSLQSGSTTTLSWSQNIGGATVGNLYIVREDGERTILATNVSLAAGSQSVKIPTFVSFGSGYVWNVGMIVGTGANTKYFSSNKFALTAPASQAATTGARPTTTVTPIKTVATPTTTTVAPAKADTTTEKAIKQAASSVLSASEVEKIFKAAQDYMKKYGR